MYVYIDGLQFIQVLCSNDASRVARNAERKEVLRVPDLRRNLVTEFFI